MITSHILAPSRLVSAIMIIHAASIHEQSLVEVASSLVEKGYRNFDDRSWSENSSALILEMLNEAAIWGKTVISLVMQFDVKMHMMIRSAAREFNLLESQFIIMCLAHAIKLENL